MKDFKKLMIWQKAMGIAKSTYELTSSFPLSERYGLASQMQRCSVSIASNIAEGSSRRSEKDYFRFLEIALGSCFELETQCILLREIAIGEESQIEAILNLLEEECMMLHSLMNKLNLN